MPETTNFNIPFLDGTELVRDYPTFSEDLANAVDAGLVLAGGLLQVVQTVKTDVFAATGSGDVPGLSLSITPSSISSKVLITVSMAVDYDDGGNTLRASHFTVFRGATNLSSPDTSGAGEDSFIGVGQTRSERALQTVGINFLDSPATTSSVEYKVNFDNVSQQTTTFINRSRIDDARAVSTITAMEVAV